MSTAHMTLEVRNRQQWRQWLATHHASSPGIWLVRYKQQTGVKSMRYEDLVREALCFGWVDSLIKRLDDDRYAIKVTPRKPTSKWSDLNRTRWKALQAAGLLAVPGSLRLPPRTAMPQSRTFPSCQRTSPRHSRRTAKPGRSFRHSRPETDVILSRGFTQPSDPRRGRGAFANRSVYSQPGRSSA